MPLHATANVFTTLDVVIMRSTALLLQYFRRDVARITKMMTPPTVTAKAMVARISTPSIDMLSTPFANELMVSTGGPAAHPALARPINACRNSCSHVGRPALYCWFVALPQDGWRSKMRRIFSALGVAAVVILSGLPADAATCPTGYKVFLNTPNQWNTPGNWSVSKPCCRGSGGDVEIAYCVAYAKKPVGSASGNCKPGDAKCNQGHDVRKGSSQQQ